MINLGFQQAAFENKLQRVFIVPSLIKVLLGLKVEGFTGMVLVSLHFVWGATAGSLLRARKKDSLCSLLFLFLSLYFFTFFTRPAYYVKLVDRLSAQ